MIRSIDDNLRSLDESMLIIADEKKPVAIAGIMGGKDTEINDNTVNVLLESANFSGPSIMKTSANLGLRSEASNRFEKKIDPELTVMAIKKFSKLLSEITGMPETACIYDNYRKSIRTREIILRMGKITDVLGKEISACEVSSILSGLGIENEKSPSGSDNQNAESIKAVIPSSRYDDLEREIDLIEEIARIYGFDKFKSCPMISPLHRGKYTYNQKIIKQARAVLANLGLYEVINYSFIGEDSIKVFKLDKEDARYSSAVKVLNPLNEDFAFLRTTPMPLMVKNISGNLNRGIKDISIFEITKVYQHIPGDRLPKETTVLSVMMTGKASVKSWNKNDRNYDYYDIKGILEYLCSVFYKNATPEVKHKEMHFFHPVISGEIAINGKPLGIIGKLHPAILDKIDISQDIFYLEIDMDVFIANIEYPLSFETIPAFPSADIDIAIVVDIPTRHSDIEAEIRKSGTKILKNVRLFDIYSGKQIEDGKKSIAYSLSFQDNTRTLKDGEVDIIVKRILDNLKRKFGARLRE
ncbi:MAG: Phenylalanine--tRNA ligase beta subunit [Actinobacteria bacterium ADurb.Bin346]|nr:MAG: Phenylalanine--tRNA ligase beta subunit [Actinobacteria bacterium ADurb.Bin346]